MNSDTIIESVQFLLKSVQKLSDRFIESNQGISTTFEEVMIRLSKVEERLTNMQDEQLLDSSVSRRQPELPIADSSQTNLIRILNVPEDSVLDIYRNTPALLEPFARPCSLSGKTLSGEIEEIELEVFAQGTVWIIELQNGAWVLVPRPGALERQAQVDGLARMFDLNVQGELPANLDMLEFATAAAIEHGRRWYLKEKGKIGIHTDPLRQSLENRLRTMEKKLAQMQITTQSH